MQLTQNRSSKIIKLTPVYSRQERPAKWNDRLVVYLKEKIELIRISDIVFLKSDSNYCHIHLSDGTELLASQTLKHFSQKLNPNQFIRVHQSYFVHKNYIKTYFHQCQSLLLSDGSSIPVSRKNKAVLFDFFGGFG